MEREKGHKVLTKENQVELLCVDCQKAIITKNVDLDRSLAKCEHCDSLFSLEENEFEKRRSGYPIFLVPEGTEILRLITSLEISSSWFKASKKDKIKFDFIMASTFSIMSGLILFGALMTGSFIFTLFSFVFAFAGIILLYLFIANLINKTYVRIEGEKLSITHKPLKFFNWKEIKIPVSSIRQLFVKEFDSNRSVNNEPLKTYGLFIRTDDGKEIKIIDDMNRETSLFIEQEIEEFLDISDMRMKNEIKKA